ncbi:MAG TPA: GYD domain-containing protein [Actinomycetes bacterium]|nr:GYD domain-containing protein [Actinomycetes bacterium]
MPHFLVQFSYTPSSVANLVHEPDVDHAAQAAAMVASVGATMLGYWYCFGEFDGAVVFEAPDPAAAAAIAMAIRATGEVTRMQTTALLTMDEARKAAHRAAAATHLPPTGSSDQ